MYEEEEEEEEEEEDDEEEEEEEEAIKIKCKYPSGCGRSGKRMTKPPRSSASIPVDVDKVEK